MNYIFLDIDGVLNSVRSLIANYGLDAIDKPLSTQLGLAGSLFYPVAFEREHLQLDELAVKLLKHIVEKYNSKIIISSTQRIGSCIEHFHKMFELYGWDTHNVITGFTPITKLMHRGDDIKQWFIDHDISEEATNYVIIDDCNDVHNSQLKKFVHIDAEYGLTHKHLEQIDDIFQKFISKYN